jgi:hypothetical protein
MSAVWTAVLLWGGEDVYVLFVAGVSLRAVALDMIVLHFQLHYSV